ncbi:(2Fe-2S)-binding protein [Clostridium celatum]|uniref:Putative carbon monoxide dehydrogenase, small subunit n=1 Tax=Clostridium celatum DSM 1785 TaxID=545697 RepID=L1QLG4_9CLOT|nr:(2Fe-2S)-binding protein [Clostridium celatum]EKY28814.1 putative carbon monoxide dehydrogenase, small subunit [Clostridium celatum DSM 1785]MCE9656720.1 (2Fe-2S)-binding protein [Clostridium celatum]MDU3723372.1 (2Fe-2S)-binding protein [Clostridium celatum]MDU6297299.1 (2Fe-2S)-binding protein [Clostridium celatum]MDY3360416.1 (2Fe-2S)-binding protein [Clostridium celatum]
MFNIKVSINVNGINYCREIDPTVRLIDFLRDELKLKGTKEGCGEGECGACTVIVNGKTINSCLMLASSVNGKNVITIEGVSYKGKLHPIQEAFMEVGAVQCGYCTPGMILSAKALLDKNPNANEEEIKVALSGNLCRCTGYKKIIQAILLAESKLNNK